MRARRWLAGLAVLVCVAASLTWHQTRRAVETGHDPGPAFAHTQIDRHPPANIEYVAAPAAYKQAILYRGRLYLCGPTGLYTEGSEWRVGQHLPAAPLVAMATGIASDSQEPELWIATSGEGLLAFNGRTFRHIRPGDFAKRKLTTVIALSSGRILMGTESSGILVYDGRTLSPLHHELNTGHVTALAGDDQAVWIGIMGKGLREWRGGEVRTIPGLPDSDVLSLATHNDIAYAGTALGTAAIQNGSVQRVYGEGLFSQSLLADKQQLVIGTLEQGVVTLPLDRGRGHTYDIEGSVTSLLDARGMLLAVGSNGVHDVRSGKPIRTAESAQLTDRNISALSEDTEARLWIGYFDRGLDILSSTTHHVEDEHVFCVNRIAHGPEYSAVATANGLALLDRSGRKRQVLTRDDGLIATHVTDVAFRDTDLVAATPAGLTFLEGRTPRSLYVFHGLVNNHVYTLGAAEGSMLAGTLGGVSLLRGDVVQANYTTANSRLPHNWITASAKVGDEWWLGTYGAGVVRLTSEGRIATFPDMPKCIVNPNALLVREGRVYSGTLSEGLLIHSEGRWRNASEGLPSMNVTALARSASGTWIGTDNGLVRLK